MKMDEIGVGGRHDCASQDPAAKCSRQEFGGLESPSHSKASAGTKRPRAREMRSRVEKAGLPVIALPMRGDGWKIGIDGATADWTLNRFSPKTP
jgi:hypothetical protein